MRFSNCLFEFFFIHLFQVAYLATLSRRQFWRTQHGVICPDCNQEVAHTCSSSAQDGLAVSLQPPLSRREYQSPSNPSGFQADPITTLSAPVPLESFTFHNRSLPLSYPNTSTLTPHYSGNPPPSITFGSQNHVAPQGNELVDAPPFCAPFQPSTSQVQPLQSTSSMFTSDFTNPDFNLSLPHMTVPSSSGVTSCPPLLPQSSILTCNSNNNNNPWSGKRDLHRPDTEYEPQRKRIRQDSGDIKNTDQQGEFHPSQGLATSSLSFQSLNEFASTSTTSTSITSTSVPSAHSTTSKDVRNGDITSGQGIDSRWSLTYNTEVKRAIDVKLVHSLNTGIDRDCEISDLKFSQDGKYLAVGFWVNGTTNVYDMQTGKKTWLVFHEFLF